MLLGALMWTPAWADPPVARDGDVLVDDSAEASCRLAHGRAGDAAVADGCWRSVRLRGDRIELSTPVYFDYDKDRLRPVSFAILDEVAAFLRTHPALQIEIQGHDGIACPYCAIQLSDRRAKAVRAFLIARGIAGERLDARGYGDAVPLVAPRTAADRWRNVRIELRVVPRPAPES